MTLVLTATESPAFAPHGTLAESLLPHATDSDDGSHDIAHLQRVWKNASAIQAEEGGDGEILAAAVLLHDCVTVEKNDPMRPQASRLAAHKAAGILEALGWAPARIEAVSHAIASHSFSAGIAPETLEARILQDADRLDAIGMVGVARCFYVAGRLGSGLYDPLDPQAATRPLDDARFALDHFENKLFKLAGGFQTRAGAKLATARQDRLRHFYTEFLDEI